MFLAVRWRLVGWNVLVFGLVLLLLGVAAYGVFASRIYSEVDQELRHQRDRIVGQMPAENFDPVQLFYDEEGYVEQPFRVVLANAMGQVVFTPMECPAAGLPSPLTQCLPTNDKATSKKGIMAAIQTGQDLRTVTFNAHPWRVLTFDVIGPGGVITGIVQVSREVSGEESALRELRLLLISGGVLGLLLAAVASLFLAGRALVPITQAFQRQRQFTADASHELRTPLALIRANAEMLYHHAGSLPPEDSELIGEIISETEHLNRLVGDLLTLARAEADSLTLASRPVDFRALVADVHDDLRAIAESRGIQTTLNLNGPVTVQGDEGRLRQLLLILLDNALKYTDSGGRVDVSVGKERDQAQLVVIDTGIGIPRADLPHIFERFYRVDRAREHESGGTGLGLAIARWIVQAHHGSIKVDSDVGKGARFEVDLPAN